MLSLDGFAFALANDGRFLYVSETVSIYLGLSQVSYERRLGQQQQLSEIYPVLGLLSHESETASVLFLLVYDIDGRFGSFTWQKLVISFCLIY